MKANPFSYLKSLLPKRNGSRPRPAPAPQARPRRPTHPAWAPVVEPSPPPDLPAIDVPFAAIVQILPPDLRARVRNQQVFEHVVLAIPTERILPQLASGDVNISFGELRMAVPDAFSSEPDADFALVPLPLAEICRQIDPILFEQEETGMTNRLSKPPEPIHRPASRLSIFPGLTETPPVSSPEPPPKAIAFALPPKPLPEPAPIPAPAPVQTGAAPVPARSEADKPLAAKALVAKAPVAKPPVIKPSAAKSPISEPLIAESTVAELPVAEAPVTEPEVVDPGPDPLMVPFAEAAEGWPANIQKEIRSLSVEGAELALPMELTAKGLKQGRLVYSWRALRHWIRPAVPDAVSPSDQTQLELPLKAVAPRFMARQHGNPTARRKAANDEAIPDLFFGGTPPTPSAPGSKANGERDSGQVAGRAGAQPEASPAPTGSAPHQLVLRATALKGVAGALIALTDGLSVASSFPRGLNPETVAAFLPPVFSKLNQYTRELKMGDLNMLDFMVGKVPWKVIRVNDLFFAFVGCVDYPLPAASLAALAAELRPLD